MAVKSGQESVAETVRVDNVYVLSFVSVTATQSAVLALTAAFTGQCVLQKRTLM